MIPVPYAIILIIGGTFLGLIFTATIITSFVKCIKNIIENE